MEYDERLVKDISNDCGSDSIRGGWSFCGFVRYHCPAKFLYDFYGDKGFYAASTARDHVRLLALAVRSADQGKGIGRLLFLRLAARAKALGVARITFRTSIHESAHGFYDRMGCRVTGLKDDDFVMEYTLR